MCILHIMHHLARRNCIIQKFHQSPHQNDPKPFCIFFCKFRFNLIIRIAQWCTTDLTLREHRWRLMWKMVWTAAGWVNATIASVNLFYMCTNLHSLWRMKIFLKETVEVEQPLPMCFRVTREIHVQSGSIHHENFDVILENAHFTTNVTFVNVHHHAPWF